jgi:hypothetical protein
VNITSLFRFFAEPVFCVQFIRHIAPENFIITGHGASSAVLADLANTAH